MANPLITIGNELRGDVITREMTDEENAIYKNRFKEDEKHRQIQENLEKEKNKKKNLILSKLNLSEEELALLLS